MTTTTVDRLRARLRAFFVVEMYGEAATAEDAERNLPGYQYDLDLIVRVLLDTFRGEEGLSDEEAAARALVRFDKGPEPEA